MAFTTRITVAFGDVDSAGLVYYPHLFHYCHIAMERFFKSVCGVSYSDLIRIQRLGFPTVKIDSEFYSPLFYGDEVEVEVVVSAVGTSSVTLEYTLRRISDQTLCVLVTAVQVCMELDQRKSIPLAPPIRESLCNELA
jgi:4-hydroxybenzoyl-CoA thioesterase